jgi:NADPH-dependent ferric siderophore reductase
MAEPAQSPSDGKILAARVGATLWDLEVVETSDVAPGMRRIRLTAPGLDALAPEAGQDLMLAVPTDTDLHRRRRYTIRRFVPEALAVDIDIVLHGDGPGARWAVSTRPGDHIEAIGPRGKVVLTNDAEWHLFAGDESGIPATLAMIEALPNGSSAIALLEVPGRAEEQPVVAPGGAVAEVRWLHRGQTEPGRPELLVDAVRDVAFPDGRGHAYLTGELEVVGAMRQALLARGLGTDQLSPKPYWRRGVANAPHGEPPKD